MKKPLIYIAGPYRGDNGWIAENNIRRAEQRAYTAARMGAVPVCPHSMYRFYDRTLNDQFWIDATLQLLAVSSAIWLSSDWYDSAGTIGERDYAVRVNIPILENVEHVKMFIDSWEYKNE